MTRVADVVSAVLAAQAASGAFVSWVGLRDGPMRDENGFVTAITCELLWPWRRDPGVAAALDRAFGFLQRCRAGDATAGYGFYPADAYPGWMTVRLPPDADDTALIGCVLYRYGRLDRRGLRQLRHGPVARARLTYLDERSPGWHKTGISLTWIDDDAWHNPVDLIVNVNVLTLLETNNKNCIDATATRAMIGAALAWAGGSRARLGHLTPWYPDPAELLFALERARRLGVVGLEHEIAALHRLDWVSDAINGARARVLCGSGDGRFQWTSPVVDRLHAIMRARVG